MQKYLGDCTWWRRCQAVARANPALIEKAFQKRTDGTLRRHHLRAEGPKWVPVKVHIDADLPHNDWYHLTYASGRDEKELWPALLEKAFAQRAGSYREASRCATSAGPGGRARARATRPPTCASRTASFGRR